MWPLEHLAVGYLLYSAYIRLWHRRAPRTDAVVVAAVATQLPDLIDKPLAWGVGAIPTGHSLAHSLLFAVPLIVLISLDGRRYGADWAGAAFGIGYLSHLLADATVYVLLGDLSNGAFLVWPLVDAPFTVRKNALTVLTNVFEWYVSLFHGPRGDLLLAFDAILFAMTILVWHRDGYPGIGPVVTRARTSR